MGDVKQNPATRLSSPARKNFRQKLIAGLWILALVVSMAGWLVALVWIAYLLIKRLVS
jgi:hypothetical protein